MGLLKLKSEEQIFGDMFSRVLAEVGLNDANPGSVLSTLLEAAAAEDFEQYMEMVAIIRNFNLDTTTGQDLVNKAFEFGLEQNKAKKSTGLINILRPASFVKIATTFYAGKPAPVKNGTIIYVNDASSVLYGTSGTLVIGRGTSNEEQVTYSSAPINNTNYWTITVSTLSNNHGLDETVVLAQGGDINIAAGTLVIVPSTGTSPEIDFTTDQDVTLSTGESELDGVSVTCSDAGSHGNIPINAINGSAAFPTPPFSGARAINTSAYTTGQDLESDDELRGRIKNAIQSLSKGIKAAIKNGIIGLVDPETAKRVVSAGIILPVSTNKNVQIFIDDGAGFEPTFLSQGFETLLDSANGGETRLQLQHFPLVKAQVQTNVQQPFDMSAGSLTLTYTVGGTSETVTFFNSDFSFTSAATAQEVVTAINARATLIQARTADGSSSIVITAVADTNETLQVTGGTANAILLFPTDSRSTLYLYVNDRLLYKDGNTAAALSNAGPYNFSGLGGGSWPLNITVDGKSANPQIITFVTGDFLVPSAATAQEVVTAINARLAGATASLAMNSTKVQISSNLTLSALGQIHVTGGSANSVLGFSTSNIVGSTKDYELNRFLGQIELANPLLANANVTASSHYTRAYLRTASPESYAITTGQTLVVGVDGVNQTVTFANTGTYTASQLVGQINPQLTGAFARVRAIGGLNYLELSTSTYDQSQGSIAVSGSSTAAALNFTTGTTISNQRPQAAYRVSGVGPYVLLIGHSLIVVLDDSPTTETFNILMNYDGTVTTGTSTTVFRNSAYNTIFPIDDMIKDYYVVFTSGPNTTSSTGGVMQVANVSGSTWRYYFASLPTNLNEFGPGDHISFTGMQNSANNGSFIVTSGSSGGIGGYVEVTNPNGVAEAGSTGSMAYGSRRKITSYSHTTGTITVSSSPDVLPSIPGVGNTFKIMPSTVPNVVSFLNNTFITPLSNYANIEPVWSGTKVQITSQKVGSDGWVQIAGGFANAILAFSTTLVNGLQGYQYFTGLLALVNKTIYGDDTDSVSYPGIGAGGIQFDVEAPTVKEVQFNLTLTLSHGFSLTNLSDQIKTAITQYVNGLGVGNSVILSEVIAAVMAVTGVADVKIVSPSTNILIGQNQLSRSASGDITLG